MADFDLFVIGGGSGGVRASRIAAGLGAKVAIAEEYRLGGTCVIRGCIPKKLLYYGSHFQEEFEQAQSYGWKVKDVSFDWKTLTNNVNAEVDRLNKVYYGILKDAGIELYEDRAVLKDRHTIEVGGQTVTADTILIATGGAPFIPDIPGARHAITSNEVFHLKKLPKSLMIAGAGYIAVEFAGIFNSLGVDTTVVYRKRKVLRGFDEDLRARLTAAMEERGIKFIFDTILGNIEKTRSGLKVTCTDGSIGMFDELLCAVGRLPNTKGIGLENAGVKLTADGAVAVDEYSKSSVDNIYAVGDVTDRINLTPVAIKEGHTFALSKYGKTPVAPDHDTVASAVFSQPPIANIGLTEVQAGERGLKVDVYTSEFRPLKQTLTGRIEKTFIKMIVDRKTDIVIGAHMIGPDAAEIIQGVAIAVKNRLTKDQFDSTMAIHPTTAEEFVLLRELRKN